MKGLTVSFRCKLLGVINQVREYADVNRITMGEAFEEILMMGLWFMHYMPLEAIRLRDLARSLRAEVEREIIKGGVGDVERGQDAETEKVEGV